MDFSAIVVFKKKKEVLFSKIVINMTIRS